MKNTKISFLREAVILSKKADETNDITKVKDLVNQSVKLHKEALNFIKKLEASKKWDLLQGDKEYYNTADLVAKAYYKIKDKYHDLHWDLHGMNFY